MNSKILLAVFAGGALGSASRLMVLLGVEKLAIPDLLVELVATAIVNLSGAAFLGFVHSTSFRANLIAKSFFGPGFAGGFTTMSGLALITAGSQLGLTELTFLNWTGVIAQFALGIAAYWIARSYFDKTSSGKVSK